jgi:hypothetical protein
MPIDTVTDEAGRAIKIGFEVMGRRDYAGQQLARWLRRLRS